MKRGLFYLVLVFGASACDPGCSGEGGGPDDASVDGDAASDSRGDGAVDGGDAGTDDAAEGGVDGADAFTVALPENVETAPLTLFSLAAEITPLSADVM